MKVLVVSSIYHPFYAGGGSVSAKSLVDGLRLEKGIDVEVLSIHDRSSCTEVIDGVTVHRIKPPNLYWSYQAKQQSAVKKLSWHLLESCNPAMRRISKMIASEIAPDVVHFRNIEDFSPSLFYFLRKFNIPTLQTLNSYTMIEPKGTLYRSSALGNRLLKCSEFACIGKKYFSQYVTAVAGVSHATLDEHLQRGYFRSAKKYIISTRLPLQIQSRLKRPSDTPVTFGYIGALLEPKGVAEMIDAFKSSPIPGVRLLIAGNAGNQYGRRCRELAASDPRITMLGESNMTDFFMQVDMLIIPSLWKEPFPRVLVEAKSFLVPSIATMEGGTHEGVTDGETGLLMERLDQLPGLLDYVISDPQILTRFQANLKIELAGIQSNEAQQYAAIYRELSSPLESSDSKLPISI